MTSAPAPTFFRHQTRAAQFQQRFTFPPGFADTLKVFTRECLREQPENIYAWAAEYFARQALQAPQPRRSSATAGGPPQVLPETIDEETYSGLCDLHSELADVLAPARNSSSRVAIDVVRRLIQESFKLPHPHTVYLLSLMHDSISVGTRSVDPVAFASAAVPALYVFCTSSTPVEFPPVQHEGIDSVHGNDADTVRSVLLDAFVSFDGAQSGRSVQCSPISTLTVHRPLCPLTFTSAPSPSPFVPPSHRHHRSVRATDYAKVLRSAPINLTERDVAAVVAEAVCDADGAIDYRSEIASRVYVTLKLCEAFAAYDQRSEASGEWPVPFGAHMPPLVIDQV